MRSQVKINGETDRVLIKLNEEATQEELMESLKKKLTELKNNLKAEVQPILEEIQSSRERVTEIQKKYFEEFWNMLTEEQREAFSKQYN